MVGKNWSHLAIAGKLGLKMSYKKTEIMSIRQAIVSNPVVSLMNVLSRWRVSSNILELSTLQMGPIPKSWTTELVKHQQLSENWIRFGKTATSIWTPKWNSIMPVCSPPSCMLPSAGHSQRQMSPDKILLTCFFQRKILRVIWYQHISNNSIRTRTKQPQLIPVIRKWHLQWFQHVQHMDMYIAFPR